MRYVEPKLALSSPPDPLKLPDIYLLQVDEFIIFDNLKGEMQLVKYAKNRSKTELQAANSYLDDLERRLESPQSRLT